VVVTGARAEVVPEFVVPSTEPAGRSGALEAAHEPVSAFEAQVVLLQAIVLKCSNAGTGHAGFRGGLVDPNSTDLID
jgi:hypothetical protein